MFSHLSLTYFCSQWGPVKPRPLGEDTTGELGQQQMGHSPCQAQLSCLGCGAFVLLLLLSPEPPRPPPARPPAPGPAPAGQAAPHLRLWRGCKCPVSPSLGHGGWGLLSEGQNAWECWGWEQEMFPAWAPSTEFLFLPLFLHSQNSACSICPTVAAFPPRCSRAPRKRKRTTVQKQ